MSDSQAKRTLPRMLISLLITLAIGAVWFYVSLPAINLHNTGFYSFVFILLLVYILVFMIILGVDTGHQEIHLKDYLSFAKKPVQNCSPHCGCHGRYFCGGPADLGADFPRRLLP